MLCRRSTSWMSSVSLQLLRHFSIRVSPLKKQSLFGQLLRRNGSPKLTKSTQKAELFLDYRGDGAKTTQQGDASLRSMKESKDLQHCDGATRLSVPLGNNDHHSEGKAQVPVPATLSVPSTRESHDTAKLSVRSMKESKDLQHCDDATRLSVPLGSKDHHSEGKAEVPVPATLSVPSTRERSKAHNGIGGIQPSVRAQTCGKRGQAIYGDGKLFQKQRRNVGPAKVSVQPQIAREEGLHNLFSIESKPGGKGLALQTQGASQKPRLPCSELDISPLRTGSSTEISSLASQIGDEPGKCITGKGSSTERDEEDDVQNAVKHALSLLKSAVGRETNKQSKLMITYRFLSDLQQKIELVSIESAPLTHVKALLMKKEFFSASPQKLAEVLTILKLFFDSSDKACEILTGSPGILEQPLEQLQQRLKVLVEFEVDKATCYRVSTRLDMMAIKAEKYRSVLSFLKDLGLSAESRNRMLCKCSYIMRYSVEKRMQRTVNFFESIGISKPTLLKLLESRPLTLCSSVDKDLRDMHKIFQHVGLSTMEFVKALRKRDHYAGTDCFLRYKFFREQGLSDEAFATMIKRDCSILTLPIEALEAKMHFLLHTAKRDISEIIVFPGYFKFSLASRIIPRFKILEELNLPRKPSLSTLLNHKNFLQTV